VRALLSLLVPAALAGALPAADGPTFVWAPPAGLEQRPLWPAGPPALPADGSAGPRPPEAARRVPTRAGGAFTAISDVSAPTLTIFPPTAPSVGAAVVVFPGGGFRVVAIDIEGTEACAWLTSLGVTCALLKYRVPGGNHHWDPARERHVDPPVRFALQDAQRAVRLVRAEAAALGVDPRQIGVLGFSAGGYLAAQVSHLLEPSSVPVDAIDAHSSRPDFSLAIYPGHLCRAGGVLDPGLPVRPGGPPTFLLHAWDDPVDKICHATVYAQALAAAGVPAEVHLFARGGHAFGLRETGAPVDGWTRLAEAWLRGLGVLGG